MLTSVNTKRLLGGRTGWVRKDETHMRNEIPRICRECPHADVWKGEVRASRSESPMLHLFKVLALVCVIGTALGQLGSQPPSRQEQVQSERLYQLEAAQKSNTEHISAIEKLDLDRRMTRIELNVEALLGWAQLIGRGLIGMLFTWLGSAFWSFMKAQAGKEKEKDAG